VVTKTGRQDVAFVGVGNTPFNDLYRRRDEKRSAFDLAAQAFSQALDDCGIDKDDIDGLVCARLPSYQRMADMLGLRRLRFVNGLEGAGRMSGAAVQIARAAIISGMAETVALVYGNNGRSVGARYGGEEGMYPTSNFESVYGMTSPGASVSMMYRRYQSMYNVPEDALAALAINNRENARLNPNAVMQEPLSYDKYMTSRYIAEPLRLYDYCLINDGAVALILTSKEHALDLKQKPVNILGTAQCGDLSNFYSSDDFFYESCSRVSDQLFPAAGVSRDDIDCLQIYDNFTPTILFSLEGFGYCEQGESWRWCQDGNIRLDGSLPVNTSGGHTSESYMQGWALHAEGIRQARGECGDRQVPGCRTVQYICVSPIVTSHIMQVE
jgi:acetyl-CoA acetyltransferase